MFQEAHSHPHTGGNGDAHYPGSYRDADTHNYAFADVVAHARYPNAHAFAYAHSISNADADADTDTPASGPLSNRPVASRQHDRREPGDTSFRSYHTRCDCEH